MSAQDELYETLQKYGTTTWINEQPNESINILTRRHARLAELQLTKLEQEILDCDQSNVLLARTIFFCILLRAFSFLSACIRDSASNW